MGGGPGLNPGAQWEGGLRLWQSLLFFPEPAVTTSVGSLLLTSGCCFCVGLQGEQGPLCLWQPSRGAARLA